MQADELFRRYQDLQRYVDWRDEDVDHIRRAASLIEPHFDALIDDFYEEIGRHPAASRVITGGEQQIARLKHSLHNWLRELFGARYDADYVMRRWRVGLKHVEIGLDQVYTNAALARLRQGIQQRLLESWNDSPQSLATVANSLNKLIDLDLAIIEDAYEADHTAREQQAERERMEKVVHREREFSQGMLERAQVIVLLLDTLGRILRFNAYTEQLTGYRLEDVRDRDWFEAFLPAANRERVKELFFRSMLEGTETATSVSPIVTKSGELREISWSNKALKDSEGKVTAVLAIGQDVTELQEAQQRALQAERLAAIGQMMTGLAHESRNALQRIQANAEMLELEVEDNQQAIELVQRIQSAQEQLHRLFEEVRGYAAPVKLDLYTCHLREVWREAWEILARQRAQRRAELKESADSVDLRLPIDRFRLVQVFRNLLENSLAACEDPVEITLEASEAKLGDKRAVRVVVRDNGPGIPPQMRERIFQPFFTTKPKGTGLGMSIAQRIVQAHGGEIALGDDASPGTAVEITLPRDRSE